MTMNTDEIAELYLKHGPAFRALLPPERFRVMAVFDDGTRLLLGQRNSWHVSLSVATDRSIPTSLAVAAMTGVWPAMLWAKHGVVITVRGQSKHAVPEGPALSRIWYRAFRNGSPMQYLRTDEAGWCDSNYNERQFETAAEAICAAVEALVAEKRAEEKSATDTPRWAPSMLSDGAVPIVLPSATKKRVEEGMEKMGFKRVEPNRTARRAAERVVSTVFGERKGRGAWLCMSDFLESKIANAISNELAQTIPSPETNP